jgi:hypothetical protein
MNHVIESLDEVNHGDCADVDLHGSNKDEEDPYGFKENKISEMEPKADTLDEEKERFNRSQKKNKRLCESLLKNIPCQETKNGKLCNFAHSTDELNVDTCSYGIKCYRISVTSSGVFQNKNAKGKICNMIHNSPTDNFKETMDNYLRRLGYDSFIGMSIPKISSLSTTANAKLLTSSSSSSSDQNRNSSRYERDRYDERYDERDRYDERYDERDRYDESERYDTSPISYSNEKKRKSRDFDDDDERYSKFKSSKTFRKDVPNFVTIMVPKINASEFLSFAVDKGIDIRLFH